MKDWKYCNPNFECDKLNYDLLTFSVPGQDIDVLYMIW